MLMYQYPYGNAQQLNLDWLLNEWRRWQQQVENMIAAQWSDTDTYTQGAVVILDHVLYICDTATATVGEFVPEEWLPVTLSDLLGV